MKQCAHCTFNITDLHKTNCCGACANTSGKKHGPKCPQIRSSYATVLLQHGDKEFGPYRLHKAGDDCIVFNANYKKDHMTFLMINKFGDLQCGRGGSFNAHFQIDADGGIRQARGSKYIGVGVNEGLKASLSPTALTIRQLDGDETFIEEVRKRSKKPQLAPVTSVFTPLHSQQLLSDGYCVLKSAVSPVLVREALREVNSHIFSGNASNNYGLSKSPHLLNLIYNSVVANTLNLLLGKVEVINGCQVALRPPEKAQVRKSREGIPLPEDIGNGRWHIDGQDKPGVHSPFTVLVGVCLSDVDDINCGNFTVWPGSHLKMPSAIREHQSRFGPSTPLFSKWRPDMGPSKQLTMKAGDVVIAHQKLSHQGGPNAGTDIRYQVYYRVSAAGHQNNVDSGHCLNNIWHEFPGLQN